MSTLRFLKGQEQREEKPERTSFGRLPRPQKSTRHDRSTRPTFFDKAWRCHLHWYRADRDVMERERTSRPWRAEKTCSSTHCALHVSENTIFGLEALGTFRIRDDV